MELAELLVLLLVLAGLLWALAPLRRAITRRITRRKSDGRYGKVIEADFKSNSDDDRH